ncbi:MAG TPA: DUF5368 domain-containing protein [Beijerinckiaceae bacterium]|nr:DUF5368 domain-containing protein [Beijerinckiaceae bacterium]
MKDLDPAVFLAVFQEILGPLFWPLVAVIVLGALGLLFVLVRERGIVARRFVWSQVVGLAGGAFGIWFMLWLTNSRMSDGGGPVDWLLSVIIWVVGAAGAAIGAYVVLGLITPRRTVD